MQTAKSMEIRDNFKEWCALINSGETVRISRPGKNDIYMIDAAKYDRLSQMQRMLAYKDALSAGRKIESLKRLDEIADLKENWNNNGAPAFSEQLIKTVRLILLKLPIQPEVFPTAADSIQFEWEKESGDYLEMEITETRANVFIIAADGQETSFDISPSPSDISRFVEDFYA